MNRSSSKTRRKCTPAPVTAEPKTGLMDKQSPRSPLKDLNGISCSTSSSTSSMSIESPKGCLRFFLSNSSSSRTPLYNRPRNLSKIPKSAPNVRPSKPSRSKPPKDSQSKPVVSANQERPILQRLPKSKKDTPCLYQWQSGKKLSFRTSQKLKPSPVSNTSGISGDKLAAGSEDSKHQQQQQLQQPECSVRMLSESDAGEASELGILSHLKDENLTPVSKLSCGSELDCAFDKAMDDNTNTIVTTTPPVEASISPEIHSGLPVASTTPAFYGAGHVLSGVSDKRKCKPRGILTIGHNDLEFDIAKTFDENDDTEAFRVVSNSRASLVPLPAEASINWLPSPLDEEYGGQNKICDNESNRFRRSISSTTPDSPSSPSGGNGLSSYICNSSVNGSNCNTASCGSVSRRRRSHSSLSPIRLPEFQGLLRPLSDHMDGCSLPSSHNATPICKVVVSHEKEKHSYDLAGENSPCNLNTMSSGNVMQTPQSDSSPDRDVGLFGLNTNDDKKNLFESELDAVAEILQRTSFSPRSQMSMWDPTGLSFEFDCVASPPNSIDFAQLQKTWDQTSWISNSPRENLSESQMRISWREGLVSRIFEMDELDCCRCLSDEEADANACSNDLFTSHLSPDLKLDASNAFGSPKYVDHEPEIDARHKEKFPLQRPSSCAESISTDGGGLVASGDSDWTLCYRNHLFKY